METVTEKEVMSEPIQPNAPVASLNGFSRGGRPRKLSDEAFLSLYVKCGGNLTTMESQLTDIDYRTLQRYATRLSDQLKTLDSETSLMREELKPLDVLTECSEIVGWVKFMKRSGVAEDTLKQRLYFMRKAWVALEKKRPISITSNDVMDYKSQLEKEQVKGAVFSMYVAFRSFYTYLAEEGESQQIRQSAREEKLLRKGMTKGLKNMEGCTPDDYLTHQEFALLHPLIEKEGLEFHAACCTAVTTASRLGGFEHFKAKDLFENGKIHTLEKGSHGGKDWTKNPSPHASSLIKQLIESKALSSDASVFPHFNSFNSTLKEIAVRVGLRKKIRFHTFRHTFATWAFQAKIQAKVICQMGGWDDEATMERFYASVIPEQEEELRRAVDPLRVPT